MLKAPDSGTIKPFPWVIDPGMVGKEWAWFWEHVTAWIPFMGDHHVYTRNEIIRPTVEDTGSPVITTVGRAYRTAATSEVARYPARDAWQLEGDIDFSVFVAVDVDSYVGAGGYPGYLNARDTLSNGFWQLYWYSNQIQFAWYDGGFRTLNHNVGAFPTGQVRLAEVRHAGGFGECWFNGKALPTDTDLGSVSAAGGHGLNVGSFSAGGNDQVLGDYQGIYIFKGYALTDAQVRQLTADPWGPFRLVGVEAYGVASATATYTKTTSLDAAIQATLSKSASFDAAVQKRLQKSASLDAAVQATIQKTVSLEAAIRATLSALVSLDGAIRQEGLTKTLDLDAAVQSRNSVTANLDAALQVLGLTKTTSLDAAIQAVLTKSLSLDASIISGTGTMVRTVDFDAAIQQVGASLTVLMSAAIMVTGSVSASLDAALIARNALTVGVDAAILRMGLTKSVMLDAYLYDPSVTVVTPTPLDGPLPALALQLIRQFGEPATLTYVTRGSYDPATGTATKTSSAVEVSALVEHYRTHELGGTIQAGDLKVIVPAKDLTKPETDDRFTIGSRTYQVVNVKPVYSGELVAIYQLQVRR